MTVCGFSQNQQVRTLDNRGTGWMNDLIISEYNGQPFKSYYKDVQGSPFFFDDWKFADITLSRGKKFEKIKARIDLCSHEAHFVTTNNVEIVTPKGLVTEIIMFDSIPGGVDTFKFKTGFPSIENQNETNFYEVLSDGPAQLLKSTRKKIVEHKDDISGQVEKVFDAYEEYYVFRAGQMRKLKKEKAAVLELLPDQTAKMEEFIKLNKTNFKKTDNLIKLFDFYNSLK
jgi:hypothetical protein